MLTLAAYVLLLTVVIEGTMAQNYCQWSGIAHNSGSGNLKESAYYVSMYLFESSSCSGTSCTLNAVYPTVNRVADNVPASNVKYICDNQSHPAGSNTMITGAQVAYICTVCDPSEFRSISAKDFSVMDHTLPQFPWLSSPARCRFLVPTRMGTSVDLSLPKSNIVVREVLTMVSYTVRVQSSNLAMLNLHV